jgi:Ni/Co efflux regulator RcnB
MNKLSYFFKFGTVALVIAAAVQCSSVTQDSSKDAEQDAEGKIHRVKDVSQDASQENAEGNTVATRFNVPVGYTRKAYAIGTFGNYLQQLPLKPAGTLTKYYNGEIKDKKVAAAVIDMSVGNRDLQQCADAIMRLRAEWLFSEKRFNDISFNLTNGFNMKYSEWKQGKRLNAACNGWNTGGTASESHDDFMNYMKKIFTYAGTLSLSKELQTKNIANLEAGDVFIKGGSPGHAVVVVDVAEGREGKVFLLAQSYMPAQDIEILKNLNNAGMSPWFKASEMGILDTPEYDFDWSQLKTWP